MDFDVAELQQDIRDRRQKLQQIRNEAIQNIRTHQEQRRNEINQGRHNLIIKPGDFVCIRINQEQPLDFRFSRPMKVLQTENRTITYEDEVGTKRKADIENVHLYKSLPLIEQDLEPDLLEGATPKDWRAQADFTESVTEPEQQTQDTAESPTESELQTTQPESTQQAAQAEPLPQTGSQTKEQAPEITKSTELAQRTLGNIIQTETQQIQRRRQPLVIIPQQRQAIRLIEPHEIPRRRGRRGRGTAFVTRPRFESLVSLIPVSEDETFSPHPPGGEESML
eukprot:Gregarina_sp_Poly_1__5652@NODE_297_length_9827_cov_119_211168_g245_i1_p5_GENE_NODE_297_length_9827_cov_119_211168_g245_i1NODE_297_length_9827_cov_119_211168_g245_i1_p5_ORF_typecomplete_len281_score33_71MLVIN_C/PF18697_1/0_032SPATA3/PF15662_5/6_3_NODE_297_length_9827_cov_119_211168_g245_i160686910